MGLRSKGKPLSSVTSDETTQPPVSSGEDISSSMSLLLLISLSFGSCIVIIPHTMVKMGMLGWFVYTTVLMLVLNECSMMLSKLSLYVMDKGTVTTDMIRYPYCALAEYAFGEKFRNMAAVILYIGYVFSTANFFILTSTTLAQYISMDLSYYEQVRVWIIVCGVASYPFMLVGSYKDLMKTTFIGFLSSSVALTGVVILCFVACSLHGVKLDLMNVRTSSTTTYQGFFVASGDILFAAIGITSVISNVAVITGHKLVTFPLIKAVFFIVFLLYILCGIFPLAAFGSQVEGSILINLNNFVGSTQHSTVAYRIILVIVQTTLAVHFLIIAVLQINPAFLILEHVLGIPNDFNKRRVLLRTSFVAFIIGFCFVFPYIIPMLAVVSCVPLNLAFVIFPVMMYWKVYDTSRIRKMVMLMILISAVAFMIAITYFSVHNLMTVWSISS